MKNLKLLLVAAVLFFGATSLMNAQSNVAHIDTQALVEAMPEMKAAQGQLEKLQKTYDAEIKSMMQEWQAKMAQYEGEVASQTQDENEKRAIEVQGMQKNIGDYRNNALEDLRKKEVDLLQPILEKAKAAIQKVARGKGIQYVFDSTSGNGVLLADGTDLLADVKSELGI